MRNFLGEGLKTNDALKFACLTGILKVSEESVFSGFNNYVMYSILNKKYSEYIGFLPEEVDKLLDEYEIEEKEDVNIGNLKIPNVEVKIAFKNMIERWFQENTGREEIEKLQIALMEKSMSSFDNAENF